MTRLWDFLLRVHRPEVICCLIVYVFSLENPYSKYYDYVKLAAFINKEQSPNAYGFKIKIRHRISQGSETTRWIIMKNSHWLEAHLLIFVG